MDPKDLISEEESQALRDGASPALSTSDTPQPEGQVQELHADHWERILAGRVPALESIAERMVSLLKATGRKFFRRNVEVATAPARSIRWGTYARRLPVPTSLNVLEIKPLKLKGVVSLSADFVFVLVDLFFGGDGRGERAADQADLTPMEHRLTRKFVDAIAADMKEAWRPFIDLDFSLLQSETNPIFASVAAATDIVSITRFSLVLDDREHVFEVILPAALIEPSRFLRDASAAGTQNSAQKWQSRLREDVQEARVSLRAVLSESPISLRDVVNAKPGDVIATELPATITLLAGDQPLLEGTFGSFQGRNAVRINKPVNRKMLGEKYGRIEDN
jgi:flagellar motor switch protein FliM